MKKYFIFATIFFITFNVNASIKQNIIDNLQSLNNITFNFEQNINSKIEKGNCTIQYPKKISCKYKNKRNKILISNGKSIVIKDDSGSYYSYALSKTPLNYILNKEFLINEIKNLNGRTVDNKYINYSILIDNNEINIFFDKNSFDLIGWQIIDIYENLNITFLSFISKNQKINNKIFNLPSLD
ncbi:outer-membrane lipoprotein carrier protein LolA [Candidatus Pelagibacter sp.]|nr:outer-membrane lipoprotein carrier protein LolA [Candidatus Pelagibacter sp.]